MKVQRSRHENLLRAVYLVAIVLLISWIVAWGPNSFIKKHRQKRANEQLRAQQQEYQAKNDSLNQEIRRLKTDPDAAEKVARENFGLIKEGEKVFRFVEKDDPPATQPKKGK